MPLSYGGRLYRWEAGNGPIVIHCVIVHSCTCMIIVLSCTCMYIIHVHVNVRRNNTQTSACMLVTAIVVYNHITQYTMFTYHFSVMTLQYVAHVF